MNIIQKLSPNFNVGRKGYKPEVIVLHIMDGTMGGTADWFGSVKSQVSSHFGVGLKGEVHQYVKVADTAWANGIVNMPSFKLYRKGENPNLYTISIEHEGHDLAYATEEQISASCELIRHLCGVYGIPIDRDHIVGHYQIDGKKKANCPSPDRSIIDRIVQRASLRSKNEEIVHKIQELLKKIS